MNWPNATGCLKSLGSYSFDSLCKEPIVVAKSSMVGFAFVSSIHLHCHLSVDRACHCSSSFHTRSLDPRNGARTQRRFLEASCLPDICRLLLGTPAGNKCWLGGTTPAPWPSTSNVFFLNGIPFLFRLDLGFRPLSCVWFLHECLRTTSATRGWEGLSRSSSRA